MASERNEPHPDDAGLQELLREVGARKEPSAEASRSVEAAVYAEWRAMIEERRSTRRRSAWGIAAGIALVAGAGILTLQLSGLDAPDVATVARVEGQLLAGPRADGLQLRPPGVPVRKGDVLRTDDRSRVALALPDGISMRLDRNTVVTFAAVDRVELDAGALYIDSRNDPSRVTSFTVQTPAGSVRHVGTQYQVRSQSDGIAVDVREGTVLIEHESGSSLGSSGESVRVTRRGEISRTALSPQDPSWAWAAATAPPFDIENQTLSAFLEWLARETGRRVVYATPQAQDAARAVRLRGSIDGLDLESALGAVLSTTQLRRYDAQTDAIGIALSAPIGSAP